MSSLILNLEVSFNLPFRGRGPGRKNVVFILESGGLVRPFLNKMRNKAGIMPKLILNQGVNLNIASA
jgi:hypothetical protein